ncbi:hypothetical protein HanIR_Chr07g0303131 [Helianthus annuus]|nr:hypothetical protein HanIR_Chr07g0303131 [Helianthus annuus]
MTEAFFLLGGPLLSCPQTARSINMMHLNVMHVHLHGCVIFDAFGGPLLMISNII